MAAKDGIISVFQYLIKHDKSYFFSLMHDDSIFNSAISHGNLELAIWIIENVYLDADYKNGINSSLYGLPNAILNGYHDTAIWLLKNLYTDVKVATNRLYPPEIRYYPKIKSLLVASEVGDLEIVKIVLDDIIKSKKIDLENCGIVQKLGLDDNACIFIGLDQHITEAIIKIALIEASKYGELDVVKYLVDIMEEIGVSKTGIWNKPYYNILKEALDNTVGYSKEHIAVIKFLTLKYNS